MDTNLLAASLLTAGLLSAPAHATTPFPNQSTLWSRDQTNFGSAVAIAHVSGDTIAVFDSNFTSPIVASVFVYQFINGAWTEVARLTPDNEGVTGGADPSVAVSDDGSFVALVLPSVIDVFQRPAGGWKDMQETAQLSVASNSFRTFTTYMGADGNDIAAMFETTSLVGEIAVFTKPVSGWATTSSPDGILTAGSNGPIVTEDLSMAVTDGLIAIPGGSPSNDIAYIYDMPVSGWTDNSPDTALISSSDISGIALSGSTLALSGSGSIKIYQGPTWGAAIATLSSTVPATLGSLLAESPNLIVASGAGSGTIYGYQKPGSAWADATDADFTITQSSFVGALAATDSTVVVSTRDQTCPAGLPGIVEVPGTNPVCSVVYTYDSGAVAAQTADLLAVPSVTGGAAFVGKSFTLAYAISNKGTASANSVQAVIPLPSVITGVHATPSQGSCVDQTTQMVCQLGALAASASADITISAVAPTQAQFVSQGITLTTTSPERSFRDGIKPLTYRVDTPPVADQLNISVFAGVGQSGEMAASDADHDVLTYRVVTQPQHGTVALNNTARPNSYLVSMSADYLGQDSFTYVANDGFTDSDPAKVVITVSKAPPPPTAHPPLISTHAGGFGVILDLFMAIMLVLRRRGLLSRPLGLTPQTMQEFGGRPPSHPALH